MMNIEGIKWVKRSHFGAGARQTIDGVSLYVPDARIVVGSCDEAIARFTGRTTLAKSLWFIHHRPVDVPNADYVIREQVASPGEVWISPFIILAKSLGDARKCVLNDERAVTHFCMPAHALDDPSVVEIYIPHDASYPEEKKAGLLIER